MHVARSRMSTSIDITCRKKKHVNMNPDMHVAPIKTCMFRQSRGYRSQKRLATDRPRPRARWQGARCSPERRAGRHAPHARLDPIHCTQAPRASKEAKRGRQAGQRLVATACAGCRHVGAEVLRQKLLKRPQVLPGFDKQLILRRPVLRQDRRPRAVARHARRDLLRGVLVLIIAHERRRYASSPGAKRVRVSHGVPVAGRGVWAEAA